LVFVAMSDSTPRAAELELLLARLEQHWREAGAPVANLAQPGLTLAEIEFLTLPLELNFPSEATAWFQWHNGAGDQPDPAASIGPHFELRSLGRMVQCYQEERVRIQDETAEVENPDFGWPRHWFPIADSSLTRNFVVVDCSGPMGHPAGVGLIGNEGNTPPGKVPSLTELVRFWVGCFDTGLYAWDSTVGCWRAERPGPPGFSPYGNYYH
jgi:hypothetical protein